MRKISTITRHRRIISHYAELLSNHDKSALDKTAVKFDLKRGTVESILRANEKYFKIKRTEFNKCRIRIQWMK